MKKMMRAVVGCTAAGALLLAGCGAAAQPAVSIPNTIEVRSDAAEKNSITVRASETVEVEPDMAEIVFAVSTENADADACQQENAKNLNQVIAYLKEQGIQETSIRTSDFYMSPRYDWSGNIQTLVGYEMRTTLTVSDVSIDQSGALISGAVDAGANEIQSVSYFSSAYDEAYEEALAKAMEMAQSKAEALAHAGGNQVTDILHIEEYNDSQAGRYVNAGSGMAKYESTAAAAEDMAVMAGQMEVQADIQVEFLLLPQ